MSEIPVGTTTTGRIRFLIERDGLPHGPVVDVAVEERDWPVTDPDHRRAEAQALLGVITDENRCYAQWFINEERNAAALAVYRPHVFDGVGEDSVPGEVARRDAGSLFGSTPGGEGRG